MSEAHDGAPEGVTDDTSAADLAAEFNQAPADQQEGDQPGDDAAAETEAEEGKPPKPRKPVQERIDELTRARIAAERERDYFRGLAEGRAPKQEQPAREAERDPEPDPADFKYGDTDPAYIKALTAFTVRQETARISSESRRRDAVETVETTWGERQQAFAKDKPDFFEKTNDPNLAVTPVMASAIKTSEDGPAVAYHLATHPAEARRIAGLPQIAQVREIGKLEARLAKPASDPKTISDAPPPNPQLRGQGGKFSIAPDTTDFSAFERLAAKGT